MIVAVHMDDIIIATEWEAVRKWITATAEETVIVAVHMDDIIIATESEEKMNHCESAGEAVIVAVYVNDIIIATEWEEKMNHNDSGRGCDSGSVCRWYNNCYRMRVENESQRQQ